MKKKLLILAFSVLILLSIYKVFAISCPFPTEYRHVLRKALIDFFTNPSAKLDVNELKSILTFYLTKDLSTANCAGIDPILRKANTTIDENIVPKCSDNTEYGECSVNKPKYCVNNNLISNCTLCGCSTGYDCNNDGSCTTHVTTTTTSSTTSTTIPSGNCDSQCKSRGYDFGTCRTSCQSGESSIGQDGCSSGLCCCETTIALMKLGLYGASQSYFYDLTADQIANTFDMSQSLHAGEASPSDPYVIKMNQVKTLNSAYKALIYRNVLAFYYAPGWMDEWNTANANGWLLKDAAGNFIVTYDGVNYMADITNRDYHRWLANTVKSHLDWYPAIWDGVMLDNCLVTGVRQWESGGGGQAIKPGTNRRFTDAEILTGYSQLLNEVIAAVGPSKLVLPNGVWNGDMWFNNPGYSTILNNVPQLNALGSEGPWWDMVGHQWYTELQWKESLDMVVHFQDNFLNGHPDRRFSTFCNVVDTPLPSGTTQEQLALFGYCSMMLAIKNNQNSIGFGFDLGTSGRTNILALAQKLRNIDVGYPLNDYYVISGTHVYARDFSKAKVLVNPTDSSYTVILGGSYKKLDGTTVSSIAMNAHTGEILFKTTTTAILKHLVDYGVPITDTLASFIGSHFDLVDFDFWLMPNIQKIKIANPNTQIIGYRDFMWTSPTYPSTMEWRVINASENWFLHDSSGNRVQRSDGEYAMNPASSGWRNYVATQCANLLSTYPMVDGIFADNVPTAIFFNWNPFTVPVANVPDPVTGTGSVITNWNTYMIGLIQTVKTAMGSKILIVNTPDAEGNFINYCDGQMIEGFMHAGWKALNDYSQDPLSGIYSMPFLEQLSATGKIVMALSGADIPQNPTPTDIALTHQCMLYCLSGFLLAYSGKANFGFNLLDYDYTGHNGYWPEMDAPIGTPVGARYNVQSNLWARDFTGGKVLLNPTTSTYTISLGDNYKTLDGTIVSSIAMSPHTGMILLKTTIPINTPINKATYAYGKPDSYWTDEKTSFMANHFTMLDAGFEMSRTAIQNIKAKNPNMRIIAYKDISYRSPADDDWAEVNQHEDWFIHDIYGNRVQSKTWGGYLMDPASGWRQHYVADLNIKFSSTPEWDGVFIDDCAPEIPPWENTFTVPYSYIKPADIARWHADMLGMLQNLKSNLLPGKIAVANTYLTGLTDYINVIDGVMFEGFAHASWSDFNTFNVAAGGEMPGALDRIAQATATGKIVWCASGTAVPSNPTSADLAQVAKIAKYSYAAFLLVLNGSQGYLGFDAHDDTMSYYPFMDTNIGQPTGAYYSSQNVYMRDFTGGKVLFNPSTSTYAINLGGNYKTLDGAIVSSITMNAHTGEILLKI